MKLRPLVIGIRAALWRDPFLHHPPSTMTPRYFPSALGVALGLTAGLVAFIPSQAATGPAATPPRLEAPAKPAPRNPARPSRKEAR